MKKCAFFDLDGTLYDGFTTSSFYIFMANKGLIPQSIVKEHDKIVNLFNSEKADYKELSEKAINLSAESLKGKSEKMINGWSEMFLKENGKFFPWVKDLLKMLKEKEYESYLISATISPFIGSIADHLGVNNFYSTELEIENGIYTGGVTRILHFDEKTKLIGNLLKDMGNCKKIGFGDSTGDVDMLSAMDESFVCNPFEEQMIRIAKEKGWNVVNSDNILEVVKSKIK